MQVERHFWPCASARATSAALNAQRVETPAAAADIGQARTVGTQPATLRWLVAVLVPEHSLL